MARLMDSGLVTCGDADCQPCVGDGYEGREMAVAAEYLRWRFRNGTLARESLDLGAHVGLWSAFLAGEYARYGGGHVYALEPDSGNFKALAENARRFAKAGTAGVEPVQAAAWSSDCMLALKRSVHPARHSVMELGPFSSDSDPSCRGIVIDNIPTRDNRPKVLDFVKVDVEGAELHAMNGMRQTIEDNPTLLALIEYSSEHFARYGCNTEKMTAFMKASGMRFARPEDGRLAGLVAANGGLVKLFFTKGDSPWQ
jgi:FkbM family methyltransferase